MQSDEELTRRTARPVAELDRRGLMKGAAAFGAGAFLGPFGIPAAAMAAETSDWVWEPMRWVQINFTEDDPGRYDPKFWLDFMRRTRTDGVCLGAGGIVAFYPTKVPFHYRSPYLGSSDPFGDMAKACKAMGMRVLARVDPSVMRPDAVAAHPDWVARSASGEPRIHPNDPSLFLSCPDGPVSFQWMPDIIREIVSTYPVDGIFGNRWSGGLVGICYCDISKREFKAATGYDLPASRWNTRDPALLAYQAWSEEKRYAQIRTYTDTVRSINPEGLFAPGSQWQRMDPKRLRGLLPAIYADAQHRSPRSPAWTQGRGAKEADAIMQGRPITGSFNVAQEAYKDSVQSIPETLTFLHDGIAQGFRPWLIKFKAELLDHRWVKPVEAALVWHAKHERYFRNTGNLAKVAMMRSFQTGSKYSLDGPAPAPGQHGQQPDMAKLIAAHLAGDSAGNGTYQALVDSRIPFGIVDDRELELSAIGKYKAIFLPNIAVLSEAQCAKIRGYVAQGGAIVATGETSLYNELGAERKNFGLADLFGCDYAGKVDRKMVNSYISIDGAHPLTVGLEDAARIAGGSRMVHVTPRAGAGAAPLRLIRPYPVLPAETAYPRGPTSDVPMAYTNTFGRGRVVYFPFDVDQTYWEEWVKDHRILIRNAVLWATGEAQPMTVTGSGLVDVSCWRQEKSVAAHLVNLNNPAAMEGLVQEVAPIGPFTVTLELPSGARATKVRLLEAEQDASFKREGGRLVVQVPKLRLHEVIAVDLA